MALKSYRTPLARVRGAGSAKSGGAHWLRQQLTLMALVPMLIYVVGSFFVKVAFVGGGYDAAIAWLRYPLTGIVAILTLAAAFYHGSDGLHEIIVDYAHGGKKLVATLFVKLGAAFLALSGIVAILKIMLGV